VTENTGQLVHLIRALNETSIDVDESTRHSERVYFLGVHNEEVPLEVAAAGETCDRVAEHVDVPIQLGILNYR
jgi:hypothetical protein